MEHPFGRADLVSSLRSTVLAADIFSFPDPLSTAGVTPVLLVGGTVPDLTPEEAITWSVSVDYRPSFADWLSISTSYFDVDYTDRIENPAPGIDVFSVLENEERYPGILVREPTQGEIEDLLALDTDGFFFNLSGVPWDMNPQTLLASIPNIAIFDGRIRNISLQGYRGLDFAVNVDLATEIGDFQVSFDGTYTLDNERKVTPTSPPIELLNDVGKPVDFRFRSGLTYSTGPYTGFIAANYTDGYGNSFGSPGDSINSWTTVDLSFRFDGDKLVKPGVLDGVSASITVQNLLNEAPPLFPQALNGLFYDPANADPLGRQIFIRASKAW